MYALFKLIEFNLTYYGKQTPSDALYYHLLPSENLKSSNGTEIKQDDITILKLNKEIKDLPTGNYILSLKTPERHHIRKIIKL